MEKKIDKYLNEGYSYKKSLMVVQDYLDNAIEELDTMLNTSIDDGITPMSVTADLNKALGFARTAYKILDRYI